MKQRADRTMGGIRSALGVLFVLMASHILSAQGLDPQVVARGRSAFQASCTQCHDADRSFQKRKSRAGWLATVRRMARLDDADVAASDIIPIATYLASLNEPAPTRSPRRPTPPTPPPDRRRDRANRSPRIPLTDPSNGNPQSEQGDDFSWEDAQESDPDSASDEEDDFDETETEDDELADQQEAGSEEDYESLSDGLLDIGSGLSTSTTISPVWRNGNDNLENPNFFVDAWFRADWQPGGPLSARATACTSCHSDQTNGGGFTLELVEAYAAYDLLHKYRSRKNRGGTKHTDSRCTYQVEAEIKAGRFVVPFGAFSSMVHPGANRTVSAPLMFNMGRQVNPDNSRPPVLPMPFSDEGVNLHTELQYRDFAATLDFYGVNGLQGFGPGVQFTPSRSYTDNNSDVSLGSRATVSYKTIRIGGSVISGRLQDEGAANLNYHIAGGDATGRFFDNLVRLYFEYAIRRNDSSFGQRQLAYGTVTEIDALLTEKYNIHLLARYDTIEHRDFFGSQGIRRFTWGLSTTALGGSTLIVNHEHWRFSDSNEPDTDLIGLRWITVF